MRASPPVIPSSASSRRRRGRKLPLYSGRPCPLGWGGFLQFDGIKFRAPFPMDAHENLRSSPYFMLFTSVECCTQSSFFLSKKKNKTRQGRREGGSINRKRRRDCRQKPLGINPFSVIKGLFHPAPLFSSLATVIISRYGKILDASKGCLCWSKYLRIALLSLSLYT